MSDDLSNNAKQLPVKNGLWVYSTAGEPVLIGSKCQDCGEIFFPRKDRGGCVHCQNTNLKDTKLSREGKILSFSVVMQKPGGGFYNGLVPYAYGYVDLKDIAVETMFDADNLEDLRLGMKVELVIGRLCQDNEGNEVTTYKFRPRPE